MHIMRVRATAGTAAAVLAAITLLAGACTAGHPPAAPVSHARSRAAGRGPGRQAAAARYLAIAVAGNHRLETDFDALEGRDAGHIARAQADLRDIAATERLFDRRLLAIALPARAEPAAHALVWLNEYRATLTAEAATSRTLAQLHRVERRLTAANRPVEQAVRLIRRELGLPPPETS